MSGCKKLVQKECTWRHDNVAKAVHWKLCEKYGLEQSEKWYEHTPESVVENERIKKISWDVCIQCDHVIEAKRPDIVIINKEEIDVDIAIPRDSRLSEKEGEKVEKYQDL